MAAHSAGTHSLAASHFSPLSIKETNHIPTQLIDFVDETLDVIGLDRQVVIHHLILNVHE